MKSSLCVLVFCTTIFVKSASKPWLGLEKANRTNLRKYEKHCLETIFRLGPLEEGEVRRVPGMCILATCLQDRNITFSGCPLTALSDSSKCRVYAGDLDKEYPECCYEIRCFQDEPLSRVYDGFVNMTSVKKRKE
ncbi:hypothetical protein TcasGA2_TC009228 [Tribolium castaneum]|uniref:Single domain-containing protein n=2 Tax=Tribolium castaneum TaxID=7070 RepID=D6WSU0_TRICA|nr:hypothetical protein TcasGA2_TC009228 [Tribolium castaneum]